MIGKTNCITFGGGINIVECTSDYVNGNAVTFTHNLGKKPEHYVLLGTSYYTDMYGMYGQTGTYWGVIIQSIVDGVTRCTQAQNSNNTGEYKVLAHYKGTLSVNHTTTTSMFSMTSNSDTFFIGNYKLWVW